MRTVPWTKRRVIVYEVKVPFGINSATVAHSNKSTSILQAINYEVTE